MEAHNKTIAKNTLFLYFRMIFRLIISLITSRIILDALGFSDFGLYNVVGGTVTMFAFLNGSMASATQRFLNFEMGKGNDQLLKGVFSTSLFLHILITILILVLGETIGLWFVNYKLEIPPDRLMAANWVFQFSMLTLLFQIIAIPFNASIIANEKMSAFAYISIFESVMTLFIVLGIQHIDNSDRLILYSGLLLLLSIVVSLVYIVYAKIRFKECSFKITYSKQYFVEMISYSGWNTLSVFSIMLKKQGVDILLNLFFGTVVNASRALAVRLSNVVNGFVMNFMQAMNPQIVKNYAQGDLSEMRKLIMFGSKFSFFLIYTFALPILIETDAILHLWLKEVPEYTVIFARLVLITAIIDSMNNTLWIGQSATGRIKTYHITLSCVGLVNLPISYIFLKMGYPPYVPLVVTLFQSIVMTFVRVSFLNKSVQLSILGFLNFVLLRALFIAVAAAIIPIILHTYFNPGILNTLIVCGTSVLCVSVSFFLIGLRPNEKKKVIQIVQNKIPISKYVTKNIS